MARTEINEVVLEATTGRAINASVAISYRNGTPATIYANSTSSSVLPNPLASVNGRLYGWLEEGSYLMSVTGTFGTELIYFESISGQSFITLQEAVSEAEERLTDIETGIAWTGYADRPFGEVWGLLMNDQGLFWGPTGVSIISGPVVIGTEQGDPLALETGDLLIMEV